MKRIVYVVVIALCCTLPIHAQEEDNPDCKDHPLFTRMPGSYIASCDERVSTRTPSRLAMVRPRRWRGNTGSSPTIPSRSSNPSQARFNPPQFRECGEAAGRKGCFSEQG